MNKSKYFSAAEFKRCDPPCTIDQMDEEFLSILDNIRADAGIPLILNCAYRSRQHDLAKGRSGNSAHTKGRAVDIRCTSSANRFKIVQAAIDNGITRIGIGKTFVHIDNDGALPQGVIFDYYK